MKCRFFSFYVWIGSRKAVILLTVLLVNNWATAMITDPAHKIDSLQQILSRTYEDTARIDLQIAIAKAYAKVQSDSAFVYIHRALALSQQSHYVRGLARSQVELGYMEGLYGSQERSIAYLKEALPLVKQLNDSTLLWDTYQQIGWTYRRKNQYVLALQYAQQALSIVEQMGDSLHLGMMKQNIAALYSDTEDSEQAIRLWKEALSIVQDLRNYAAAAVISENLANKYAEQKNYTQAMSYYERALRENQTNGDKVVGARTLANIAQMYTDQKQYRRALSYAQQASALWEGASPDREYDLLLEKTLGNIYTGLREYPLARIHYQKALSIINEYGNLHGYSSTYAGLIYLDSLMGNYREAFLNQQRLTILKDSLASDEKTKAVEELKVQYETEQKDQEIALLQARTSQQQLEAQQQRFVKNSFVAGSVALLLLLGLGYNRYRFKQRALGTMQRQNEEIQTQKEQVEQKNYENQLLLKEVHHRVKNNLQIVLSILNAQADSLRDPQTVAAIRESQHRVHSMALIHQSLYQSDNLSQIQARHYLHEIVETVCQSYRTASPAIRLQLHIEDVAMDMSTAVPVGLIITELVTNACKHALGGEAPQLRVSLRAETRTQYCLTVADNGPGLPPDFDLEQSDSLGLQLVHGLAQQLDGELVVHHQGGTCFELLFRKAA